MVECLSDEDVDTELPTGNSADDMESVPEALVSLDEGGSEAWITALDHLRHLGHPAIVFIDLTTRGQKQPRHRRPARIDDDHVTHRRALRPLNVALGLFNAVGLAHVWMVPRPPANREISPCWLDKLSTGLTRTSVH